MPASRVAAVSGSRIQTSVVMGNHSIRHELMARVRGTAMAYPMLEHYAAMQVTSLSIHPGYASAKNKSDLKHYFEYSNQGVEVDEDGLKQYWVLVHAALTRCVAVGSNT